MTDLTLHQVLKDIHAEMQDPSNWHDAGLCETIGDTVYVNCGVAEVFVGAFAGVLAEEWRDVIEKWPKYSGWPLYPVPSVTEDENPDDAFDDNLPDQMWNRHVSEYAELRWQLLEFAIEHTKPKEAQDVG